MALTKRQREVYDFIHSFVAGRGYSPSLEEIGAHFNLSSVATVHKHVQHLVEKQFLRKSWNRSRSVEPIEPPSSGMVALPLLGEVAAGTPIEAIEVPETLNVPTEFVPRGGQSYALKVRGESMIDEQIRDGDYVIVESRSEARDGETVVALIRGEETTLKKLYHSGSEIRLQPANAAMEPILVPAEELEIRGVVRGLIRRY